MAVSTTFKVFLWKSSKEKLFSWKSIIAYSFIIPIFLLTLNIHVAHDVRSQPTQIFDPIERNNLYFPGGLQDVLCFIPNNSYYNELMEHVRIKLNVVYERLKGFPSEEELIKFVESTKSSNLYAVQFFGDANQTNKLNYTIRNRNMWLNTKQIYLNDITQINNKETDEYIESGFIALQQNIDSTFIELSTGNNSFEFQIEHFPTNEKTIIRTLDLTMFGILFTIFSFTIVTYSVLIPIIEEKECGVNALLRIATKYFYFNDLTKFIINFSLCGLFLIIIFAITIFYGIWQNVVPWYPFILCILFISALISYSFFISLFLNTVEYAKIGGILFYLIPFGVIYYNADNCVINKLEFIFCASLFMDGINIFRNFIVSGHTFNCTHLLTSNTYPNTDQFNIIEIYLLLLSNCLLYFMFYFYFENIDSNKFIIRNLFNCWSSIIGKSKIDNLHQEQSSLSSFDNSEDEVAIRIRNLYKTFDTCKGHTKRAVRNVSLDILKNQITVLLGHNGAGKTTTMSMIIGTLSKTGGTIIVNGTNRPDKYQKYIGYCPQKNLFIKYFTCVDHVIFFGQLRGLSYAEAKLESDTILNKVKLLPKACEYPKRLSGGMKRRLCLAMAIIGNTKTVILDEPTSGLDPESRRELWDVLLNLRKERSVLITTHYMEEADILGDKVAIMEHGTLVCYGSPLDLKKKYGSGYVLKILANANFKLHNTTNLIIKRIPSVCIKSHIKPTVSYSLPYEHETNYCTLLKDMEKQREDLGIDSVSITNSTLEEVFLNCASKTTTDCVFDTIDELDSAYSPLEEEKPMANNINKQTFQKISAIWYKKLVYVRREWLYTLIMFSIPIVALLLSFFAINFALSGKIQDGVMLNPNLLSTPKVVLVIPNTDKSNDEIRFIKIFENVVKAHEAEPMIFYHNSAEDVLLQLEQEDVFNFNENIISAIELSNDNYYQQKTLKILFSGNIIHSSATTTNIASNIALKFQGDSNANITVINSPLLRKNEKINKNHVNIYESLMPLSLFLYILFYVTLPFSEEFTEFKSLQCVQPAIYWLASFSIDFLMHTLLCLILLGISFVIDFHGIFSKEVHILLGTVYIFYGMAYIPFLYILTKYFKSQEYLYTFTSYVVLVAVIISIFTSSSDEKIKEYYQLSQALHILPDFAIRHTISIILIKYFSYSAPLVKMPTNSLNVEYLEPLEYVGDISSAYDTTFYYIAMTLLSIVFLLYMIFVCENIYIHKNTNWLQKWRKPKSSNSTPTTPTVIVDPDVKLEEKETQTIIKENNISNYAIVVHNLHKTYNNKVNAVCGLNFKVQKGECFGLLGMNGAGKSTTFKMMTINEAITKGNIYLNNYNCYKNSTDYKNSYGYCPQVDALNDSLTAYEILKYIAMIRGVSRKELNTETELWLRKVDLDLYRNVQIKHYSGGTKRKLNTAIAMIGCPDVIFLDEPTTGVDPISRRRIWQCISELKKEKKTIILTSHSMDECEQLCNRIAIMSNGRFQCIGATQKLKENYGKGFTLVIKLNKISTSEGIEEVKDKISILFRCELKEEHADMLKYNVIQDNIVWSQVFDALMQLSVENKDIISDYSVSEVSLEDIFLQFAAKDQADIATTEL